MATNMPIRKRVDEASECDDYEPLIPAPGTETHCGIDIGETRNFWNYADTVPCQTGIRADKRRRGRRH